MKNVKILLGIIFLFISNSLFGQLGKSGITTLKGKHYYQNTLYKKLELHKVIITDKAAYEKYQEFERTRTVCDLTGYTSLTLIGIGIISFLGDDGFNDIYIIGVGATIGAIITGPIALLTLGISNKQLEESVNLFNENLDSPPIGAMQPKLELGFSQHGLGLVLNF